MSTSLLWIVEWLLKYNHMHVTAWPWSWIQATHASSILTELSIYCQSWVREGGNQEKESGTIIASFEHPTTRRLRIWSFVNDLTYNDSSSFASLLVVLCFQCSVEILDTYKAIVQYITALRFRWLVRCPRCRSIHPAKGCLLVEPKSLRWMGTASRG